MSNQNKKLANTVNNEVVEEKEVNVMTNEELMAKNAELEAQIEALRNDGTNVSVKESKFKTWKAAHPRFTKTMHNIGFGAGLVGAWMLGANVQEKRDAKKVRDAIDDGELIRASDLENETESDAADFAVEDF